MYSYAAYGLNVRSALPLPELVPGGGRADVDVRLDSLGEVVQGLHREGRDYRVETCETCFSWSEIGAFAVRGGREIRVDPRPGVDERWLRIGILGPAFAALLQQRGYLLLHASAVSIEGSAVALLGASGWGKSTLAYALHARGHPLVCDDVIAIPAEASSPVVFPGVRQFKLWPDALAHFGGDLERYARIKPRTEKRARLVDRAAVVSEAVPLGRIYLLARGREVRIEPLTLPQAFLELVGHSFGIDWLHPVSGVAQFEQRGALVRRVPVRRLRRPWKLDALGEAARRVEEDVADDA